MPSYDLLACLQHHLFLQEDDLEARRALTSPWCTCVCVSQAIDAAQAEDTGTEGTRRAPCTQDVLA